MLAKIHIILIIALAFTPVVLANGQLTTLEQEIQKAIDQLGHEDFFQRQRASQRLIAIGSPAIAQVAAQFPHGNYRARRQMTYVFGKIGGELALRALLRTFQDKDKGVREKAAMALLELSDSHADIVRKIKGVKPISKEHRQEMRDLVKIISVKFVERGLADLISREGGFGFYEGQFDDLKKHGRSAVDPLFEIFSQEKYEFIHTEINYDEATSYKVRSLAGEALAEFGSVMSTRQRVQIISYLKRMQNAGGKMAELAKIARYTLYCLGETRYFDQEVEKLMQKVQRNPRDSDAYFDLAMLYLRVKNNKKGAEYLQKVIENTPYFAIAHYNLACAYSCMGQREEAIKALQNAVRYGYDDVGWLQKDGDLRGIREDPRVQKIIRDLEKKLGG